MSRLALKLIAVLVLLAGLPLLVAFWQSGVLFERSLGAGINPRVAAALEDAVGIYGAYVRNEKARLRAAARALADSRALAEAAQDGPAALEALLGEAAAAPGVVAIELHPRYPDPAGGPPPRWIRAEATGDWLLDTERLPLAGVAGFDGLVFTYGLDRAVLDRFERMETEVIRPFAALAADRENLADIYAYSFVGYLAAAVLLAGLVAFVVGRRITRRLDVLGKAMTRVAAGELEVRVTPSGRDELAQLAEGFNHMTRRLRDSHARVEYLTQVSAWQGIARRLAHEIKNPLTPILLAVQQTHQAYKGDDPRFRRTVDTAREIVEQEVATLKRLVEHFSQFAKLPEVSPRPEDVGALVADVVAAQSHVVGLEAIVPTTPRVAAVDKGLLRQALVNLIQNADQANDRAPGAGAGAGAGGGTGSGGPATRRVVVTVADPEGPGAGAEGLRVGGEPAVWIHVDDTGPGIAPADRERIFQPYVTGRHDGTGLGLAIVKKIVLDHGGETCATAAPTGGARLTLLLPLAGPPARVPPEENPA